MHIESAHFREMAGVHEIHVRAPDDRGQQPDQRRCGERAQRLLLCSTRVAQLGRLGRAVQ
jgi:hypothetical protein